METDKYPEAYTDHYLAMLSVNFDVADENSFRDMAVLYQQVEGEDSLNEAIAEFERIIQEDDWEYLESLLSDNEIKEFGRGSFIRMVVLAKDVANPK